MDGRLACLALLALAGTALSGCVAVAIPALAGTALVGSRVDGKDGQAKRDQVVFTPAIAPKPAVAPIPTVTITPGTAVAATPAITVPPPVPAATPAARPSVLPNPGDQRGFAQFVRYGSAIANTPQGAAAPSSAVLSDPVALDGKRRPCAVGEQPVALIDLDPAGGVFVPPANPAAQPGQALGLAVLREAGVVIAWLSDLPVNEAGALRTALEQAGLDPRGEDIISLRRDVDDRKQLRKENLAANACIIAIAGDERPDFDERFRYLRNPEAGASLEPVIGAGWFLIDPVFPVAGGNEGQQGE